MDNVKVSEQTCVIRAKYTFTDDERHTLATQLAHKILDHKSLDEERKSMMSNYKDKIDGVKVEISTLSNNIATGVEWREFRCTIEYDFEKKEKSFRDVYSKNIIETRALEPQDYQMQFDMEKANQEEAAAEGAEQNQEQVQEQPEPAPSDHEQVQRQDS